MPYLFGEVVGEEFVEGEHGGVAAPAGLDGGGGEGGEFGGVEEGIEAAAAVPEHGFHAVFGVFVVDPIVPPMFEEAGEAAIAVDIFKKRKEA